MSQSFTTGVHPDPRHAGEAQDHSLLEARGLGYALFELVRDGACYVKLSAPYRFSRAAPPWPDVIPLARALVSANAAGCMWATDWPHTAVTHSIHERDLHRSLDDWCPDTLTRAAILETTPETLFGN